MNLTGKILLSTAALVAFSSSAMAADLMMPVKAAPMMAAPSTNWDGAYIGANLGYAWGNSDHTTTTTGDFTMSGGFVGGQIGYNFHVSDAIVLGVQGDVEWANISGSQTSPSISDSINWTGAVTARLGYDVDGFLPYVLGGVAFANSARTGVNSVVNSQVHTGYTVGVGVETMLADNLSAFAEVRYSDYGQKTYTLPSTPIVGLTDTSVRIGLNYHF